MTNKGRALRISMLFKILFTVCFILQLSDVTHAQEVSGHIKIEPPYPQVKTLKVRKKTNDSCANEQISQSLIVSEQGYLKNAVISLKGDFKEAVFPANAEPVEIDQKGCNFQPHILLTHAKKPFSFVNSDPLTHDVRIFQDAQMLSRFEIDISAKPVEQQLEKPGIYILRCGLHPWMHGFIVNADHPYYAVSNENGEFMLKAVPEGKHTMHIWHETLGEIEMPIEVHESIKDFSYTFKNTQAG